MRKSMPEQKHFRVQNSEAEGIALRVALTLNQGGLEFLSFDDLYYKLKTLEVDIKGYSTFSSSQSVGPSHSAFCTQLSRKLRKMDFDKKGIARGSNIEEAHDGQSNGVIASKEFGMIAGCDTEDAIEEGAAKIYNLITGANTKEVSTAGDAGEFALMGVTSETAKKDLQTKLDNHLVQTKKWRTSSKNMFRLVDSSMSVRTKVGLGFTNYIGENELGWDESAFSVFTTNSEEVEEPMSNDSTPVHLTARTGKVNIPSASPQPVPTGKPKVPEIHVLMVVLGKHIEKVYTGYPRTTVDPSYIFMDTFSDHKARSHSHNGLASPFVITFLYVVYVETPYQDAEDIEEIFDYDFWRGGCRNYWKWTSEPHLVFEKCLLCGRKMQHVNCFHISDLRAQARIEFLFYRHCLSCANPRTSCFLILKCPKGNLGLFAWQKPQLMNLCKGIGGRSCDLKRMKVFATAKALIQAITAVSSIFLSLCNCFIWNLFGPFINLEALEPQILLCLVITDDYSSPHNKTPYALLTGNIPSVSHFKPFGCHVTILNTSDHLGKFDGKADEGYIVGYSASNRAYRVYNVHNKRVEETMNLRYLEEKPNVQGLGHEWYFDLDYLTDTLGYKRVQANQSAGTQEASTNPAGTQDADSDSECDEQVIIIPSYPSHNLQEAEPKDTSSDEGDDSPHDSAEEIFQQELARLKGQVKRATSDVKDAEELQQKARTKTVPPGSIPVPTGSIKIPSGGTTISPGNVSVPTGGVPVPTGSPTDSFFDDEPTTRFPSPSDLGNNEPSLGIFSSSSYDDEFGVDLNNLASTVEVSHVATKRINTIHPQPLIIGDHTSAVQTRSKVNKTPTGESAFISYIHDQQRNNHTDFQHCLFACFLSQVEPRTVAQALEDPSWVDAMQEEMQQFKFQNRDARGIVVRNKARLVAQGHKQEEGIDYDEVFAPVARIKAIRLFLAFSSYLGFMVYQMDVKSAFLYGRIDEEHKRDIILVQVYVDDIIFGSTKKAWCDEFKALMKGEFEMSAMGELTFFLGLQVQQRPDGIFINQEKSMIGSLMYLTSSRPDIMFAVSACSRNQVTPTTSNLEAVKKIFKYLKGQPKLGLWYPRESPFMLEAYSDSDYVGANKDRKSITGGCQFLDRRLISWQCKKKTIVATSSTEAEYVAAAN
ncbi:putative ribonuclease H-like domain-containing protein, partial [Tanacetum coccineum]